MVAMVSISRSNPNLVNPNVWREVRNKKYKDKIKSPIILESSNQFDFLDEEEGEIIATIENISILDNTHVAIREHGKEAKYFEPREVDFHAHHSVMKKFPFPTVKLKAVWTHPQFRPYKPTLIRRESRMPMRIINYGKNWI